MEFFDISSAFDRIDRNMLWLKLINEGGGGSTITIKSVKAMYISMKSLLKCDHNFSRSFYVHNK